MDITASVCRTMKTNESTVNVYKRIHLKVEKYSTDMSKRLVYHFYLFM